MSKPKLLLIAYRAFGDWLFTAPILPYLFEKYDVYLETNLKGWEFFEDDPRFTQKAVFAFEQYPAEERSDRFKARWQECRELIKPDVEINLNGTLELTCIAESFQDEFYKPVGERRKIFGVHGFYDAIFERCKIPMPESLDTTGLYFSPEYMQWAEWWKKQHEGKFVVLIPIAGSGIQKVFHSYEEVVKKILNTYPDALVYLAGDEVCAKLIPKGNPRVRNACSNVLGIKQAVLLAGLVDMVVGPETGLLVAAGMWGTPKVILSTTSSVWQMAQHQKNDFSIQAPIWCSPCHRAIYRDTDCQSMVRDADKKPLYPACVKLFSVDTILERVDYVYHTLRKNKLNEIAQ